MRSAITSHASSDMRDVSYALVVSTILLLLIGSCSTFQAANAQDEDPIEFQWRNLYTGLTDFNLSDADSGAFAYRLDQLGGEEQIDLLEEMVDGMVENAPEEHKDTVSKAFDYIFGEDDESYPEEGLFPSYADEEESPDEDILILIDEDEDEDEDEDDDDDDET